MPDHRFSVNIPDTLYRALKVKAAYEGTTMKDIILFCVKETLGDIEIYKRELNNEEAILTISNKTFAEEWDSKEDEEAFSNLQKYRK